MDKLNRIIRPLLVPGKARLIPVEIFFEIFLHTVQADPSSKQELMLVCRRWYDIMLSTPGIHSQLRIRRWTRKQDIEGFGRRWLLDVIIAMDEGSGGDFNADDFYSSFMAAAQAASRWRSLKLVSLPPLGEYGDLQIVQPLQCLESFKLAPGCNLGHFLESLMTAVTTTTTPRLTLMEIPDPDVILYLGQPAFSNVFHSLTTLKIMLPKRMDSPVDILPHLQRLETFHAHHLCLPIYLPGTYLPLTQTLHVMHLKCASIQWMDGRVFPTLHECSIIFPHHADTIRSVNLPSCSVLKYDSNRLGTLSYFHLTSLAKLEVKCGQCNVRRGDPQFAALRPIFATAQNLTCLHLQVQCSGPLLADMLRLAPVLEELWLGLASPNALSKSFFKAFIVKGNSASIRNRPPSYAIIPLCSLKMLRVHYKRWLRGLEKTAVIADFGDIVASRQQEEPSGFSLCLSFDEEPKGKVWKVHEPVARTDEPRKEMYICVGVPSPHGMVPLSAGPDHKVFLPPPFRELEYLQATYNITGTFCLNILFPFHHLKELRLRFDLKIQAGTQLPPDLPLFHTLKVLEAVSVQCPILAGQTFHKLETFCEYQLRDQHNLSWSLLTQMPFCTRVVAELPRLATVKLPQICELTVCLDHSEYDVIWERRVAVNANLSGLKFLHVNSWSSSANIDPIQILRFLPALETLVLTWFNGAIVGVDFFRAFIPVDLQGTSVSAVLCPNLETLRIQEVDLDKQPELMPVLKDIVTLRPVARSSLNSFTFFYSFRQWELIGSDGSFTKGEVVPAQRISIDI